MSRRSKNERVEIRPNSLRVAFVYQGVLYRETLKLNGHPMEPTTANVNFARRLSRKVADAIRLGSFTFAEFFPDSKNAPKTAEADDRLCAVARAWIESKGQLTPATLDQYATGVRRWERLLGAETRMRDLTYQVLSSKIGAEKWPSPKSANNYLVALRGIFQFHYAGPLAYSDPMRNIHNLKAYKPLPDPLSADERDVVLADMWQRYDPRVGAYFTFAFFTGMRPEEIIALRWDDIDERSGLARVCRVRTFKGSERDGSKTGQGRDVDLLPQALEALHVMKPYTALKAEDVFENPITGEPWHDERSQRDTFWKPSLRRCKIRQRRAYCTRHTYATVALMGGVNAAYVSNQMGHASTKMFFETYARWIAGADKGFQRAAMAAAFGSISPGNPQVQVANAKSLISLPNSGRRDWIRTNNRGNEG